MKSFERARRAIGLTFLTLTLSTCLSACSGANGASGERDNPVIDYSCDVNFNKGSSNPAKIKGSEISLTYFGKFYDRSWLNALLKTSSKTTLDYITGMLGVKVYKSGRGEQGKCQNFAILDVAPAAAQSAWNAESDSDFSLLLSGVYLAGTQPTIVIRADSNKWTLLHELLHHDFELQRKRIGQQPVSVRNERFGVVKEQMAKMKDEGFKTLDEADLYIHLLEEKLVIGDTVIVNGALEEVTVESVLREAFEDGKLKYVPNKIESSREYISESAKSALSQYSQMEDWFTDGARTVAIFGYPNSIHVAGDWMKMIADRKSEILKVVSKYGMTSGQVRDAQLILELSHNGSSTAIRRDHDAYGDRESEAIFRK